MKLSVLIPAFNEEKLLRECLWSVRGALKACARPGWESEVVVCDNDSTDATAAIAREEGAKVVFEPHRQISRARNAAAAAAAGGWLLFIDADSVLSPGVLEEMFETAESGRIVGGGCLIAFDFMPGAVRFAVRLWNLISRTLKWAAGSFVFCRADAFRDVGGFSGALYAAEEIALSMALKRWGRTRGLGFAILSRGRHLSSGRKASLYTFRELLSVILRLVVSPRDTLKSPEALFHLYDRRR
ncbi:MAG: glycosyltransferase [Elusimicrobia bacterium]|nr:glycosyltransferase [Elusimicrobiota bacterium]